MARARKRFIARRLSLTPLIDVIFLLLLFFMLTSTFTRFAEVPLVQAGQGSVEAPDTPPLFLRLTEDGLTANGLAITGDLRTGLDALIDGETTVAFLSVGDGVTSQQFVATLQELQAIAALNVSVLK